MANWRLLSPLRAPKKSSRKSDRRAKGLLPRALGMEPFEERTLFAIGPQLVAVIPNEGALIQDNQVLHVAPRELTFRFTDGQIIDPATVATGIQLTRSGGDSVLGNTNDVTISPGFIGVGENSNEVIVRFASTLPDDLYQIRIVGSGATPLRNTMGSAFNNGVDLTRKFDLDLGAQVVSVVPQPITRNGAGQLVQAKDQIDVYFNDDDLNVASATNKTFYQLIRTSETATPTDDVRVNPISVTYDPVADKAVLKFNLADLATPGVYRLRIGNNDPLPLAPVAITPSGDVGSSFTTAFNVVAGGTGGNTFANASGLQTAIISTAIDTRPFPLKYPGGTDEPGHREIPPEGHVGPADSTDAIDVRQYNFKSDIGVDPFGNPLFNLITEAQKQRAREILSLYSSIAGIQFVETESDGFTIATGDLRAADPEAEPGPGGILGLGGGNLAIMDNAEDWGDSGFGGRWFRVALHEIGHVLGLGHTGDLASPNAQSPTLDLRGEPLFPDDASVEHMQYMYRPAGSDIDLYKLVLPASGKVSFETIAQRQNNASFLDSVITVFDSNKNVIARNDDYFGKDSFLELDLAQGTYYVGVTSKGNISYDPNVQNSGGGGLTEGGYDLRVNFTLTVDADVSKSMMDSTGTVLDGDAEGHAGGTYNFWFRTQTAAQTFFVDKAFTGDETVPNMAGPGGSRVFSTIARALAASQVGDIVRIVGNGGTDGQLGTVGDNLAYNVGYNVLGVPLSDGATMEIPRGVTVMIDAGAILKFRGANIDVGSSAVGIDRSTGALQVLGTTQRDAQARDIGTVFFTSYHDETIGKDLDPRVTTPLPGDWGGLVFRDDSDLEGAGAFLNYVNHAQLKYGGGSVVVNSVAEVFNPIHMETSRPTVSFNTISKSADAAMSARANSFQETVFEGSNFSVDYRRVGPDIHGNLLSQNSINGLFVGLRTLAGEPTELLTVSARFDDTDIVHVISENLVIAGNPGGLLQLPTRRDGRPGARLAIDPGVVVKLEGARIETQFGATLLAEGTASNRVIFTSVLDDRFGAGGTFDTTGDGVTTAPTAGDWGGLYFGPVTTGSLDRALVTFAGGQTPIEGDFANFNAIEIYQADVRIANSTIESNAGGTNFGGDRNGRGTNTDAAIFVRGAQPIFVNNIIRKNIGVAISIDVNSLNSTLLDDWGRSRGPIDLAGSFITNAGPLVAGNRLGTNAINGMVVRGGEVTAQSILDDADIVHVVRDEIIIPDHHTFSGVRLQSTSSSSLVVKLEGNNAGFTAKGQTLDIVDRIGGSLYVIGAPGHPVMLTSLDDDTVGAGLDPAGKPQLDTDNAVPGTSVDRWRSLRLDQYSNDRNVEMTSELEQGFTAAGDTNMLPGTAQFLGGLAASTKSGDDVLRLGFELHGYLSRPDDVDVYSFKASAGTEVWLDLDRTSPSLDSVLELVDASGGVIARSDNSFDEFLNPSLLGGTSQQKYPLQRGSFTLGDLYSTNLKDAGLRVVLPGAAGTTNTYYVRVRSSSATLSELDKGQTKGAYQLQIRLQELDEVPGSAIRYADIRNATNGIELIGKPEHSPLMGEIAETADPHDLFDEAQDLGNLLDTDRGTLAIAGKLSSAAQVDWYKFNIDYQFISSAIMPLPALPTIFDIDYADGMSRPDTTISLFDSGGNLIYVARDSNVADDQPRPGFGSDVTDLSRGSAGKLDAYLGATGLLPGTYYVAVSSNSQLPKVLDATFQANATSPLIRMEPLFTVVEDRVETTADLLDVDKAAVPFTLRDVVLFVNTLGDMATVDPKTGQSLTDVTGLGKFNGAYGDIIMRPDGKLFSLTMGKDDPSSGVLTQISTGDGAETAIGDDEIITYERNPNVPFPPPPGTSGLQVQSVGVQFEGMAFRQGSERAVIWAVGNRAPGIGVTAPQQLNNLLYRIDANTGVAVDFFLAKDGSRQEVLPTDAKPVGSLAIVPSIITADATSTAVGIPNIVDGQTFTVTSPLGRTLTFEFDSGPELLSTSAGNLPEVFDAGKSRFVGQNFTINGNTFEFDQGKVVVVGSTAFGNHDTLTITSSTGSLTLDFTTGTPLGSNKKIDPTGTVQQVTNRIIAAINNSSVNVSAALGNANNRIALTGETNVVFSSAGAPAITTVFDYGAPGAIPVEIEEYFTADQVAAAIEEAVNDFTDSKIDPTFRVDASSGGNRVTFFGANTPNLANAAGLTAVAGPAHGVTQGNIQVPFGAGDPAFEVARSIIFAINNVNTDVAPTGDNIQPVAPSNVFFTDSNRNFRRAANRDPYIAQNNFNVTVEVVAGNEVRLKEINATTTLPTVTASVSDPLTFISGRGAGNELAKMTGLAWLGGTLYGVSDGGVLYQINVVDPDAPPADPNGGGAMLAAGNPFTTIAALEFNNAPIQFAGLTLGPQNVESTDLGSLPGRYANMLFAVDTAGFLYALDPNASTPSQVLQPIFSGGPSTLRASTGVSGAKGLAFSPVDWNLWHATKTRNGDPGHSVPEDPDDLGSFYFGMEKSIDLSGEALAGSYGTYDLPGGAHGTIESKRFSLEGYTSADKPTLYFNYFLETEGAAGTFADRKMRDSIRVFLRDGSGPWTEVATNNSLRGVGTELPEAATVSGGASPVYRPGDPSNQLMQEIFDNPAENQSWRQARVDLGIFAGKQNLQLRFDFATAGAIREQGLAGEGAGDFTSNQTGQNNNFEGVFIDDIVVGIAERGEKVAPGPVATPDPETSFIEVATLGAPGVEVLVGNYQLEIRRAGVLLDESNERSTNSFTIQTSAASQITNGQLVRINDGLTTVTFQFVKSGSVTPGNIAVNILATDTAQTVAQKLRDAINAHAFNVDALTATEGTATIGRRVDLIGAETVVIVAPGTGLSLTKFSNYGDQNVTRDQGYTLIQSNKISNSLEFGIAVKPSIDERSVRNLRDANTQRLVAGLTIENNLIVNNGSGGINIEGDTDLTAPVVFSRILNNTVFGGISPAGSGILVTGNATPTLLNNILANNAIGIDAATAASSMVLGANLYQGNTQDKNLPGGVTETFAPIVLAAADPLFVDAAKGNFYLKTGSKAIDSSLNSLQERTAMQAINAPLGIAVSPILAPDNDVLGQTRVDDPSIAPPPGFGSNVFKDRGAIDRADFASPVAALVNPVDNDGADLNPAATQVRLTGQVITHFAIQFNDGTGAGVDDASVLGGSFGLTRNGATLQQGVDYLFSYDTTNNVARFNAAAGIFTPGTYVITVNNQVAAGIRDVAGNLLNPNQAAGDVKFTIALDVTPASPWQNPNNALDVNDSGFVSGLDALLIINALNAGQGGPLTGFTPPPYLDVTGDGNLTPLDALTIINSLNAQASSSSAAVSSAAVSDDSAPMTNVPGTSSLTVAASVPAAAQSSSSVNAASSTSSELAMALAIDSAITTSSVASGGVVASQEPADLAVLETVLDDEEALDFAEDARQPLYDPHQWFADDEQIDELFDDTGFDGQDSAFESFDPALLG